MSRTLDVAIIDGLAALGRMQSKDGSFSLFYRKGNSKWTECSPVFSTAYIMIGSGQLLSWTKIHRALDFILKSRRKDRLWEYDSAIGVPPDSDCTACALAAMTYGNHINLDKESEADLLKSFWRNNGGPFYTWRGEGIWSKRDRDDPVVNCNILYALDCLGYPASDRDVKTIEEFISNCQSGSRYYHSPSTIAHAAARAGINTASLPEVSTNKPPVSKLLACIQWICGTGLYDENIVQQILDSQNKEGVWPIRPWVTGTGNPKPMWGSPAVTTSLAIEALRTLKQRFPEF